MSFSNLKISRKLAFAFLAVVATIVAMSAAIYWNLQATTSAQAHRVVVNELLADVRGAEFRLARQENSFRGFLLSNDPYYIQRLESHRADFDGHVSAMLARDVVDPELHVQVRAAAEAMDEWWQNVVIEGQRLAADPIQRFKAVEMVGRDGSADAYMAEIEGALAAVADHVIAEIDKARQIADESVAFNERVLMMGLLMAVAVSVALGYLLSRMIAAPVTGLTSAMTRLAAGDNEVDVPAATRKDEIGEMARAVLVFKEAAIAKVRYEVEAEQSRQAAEEERNLTATEKERIAKEDHFAIESLARGLASLADGDLTHRITAAFAPKTQKLRDDFNRTAEKLQQAMMTIGRAVDGMRTGTTQISQAADDLSRRTEQQAANLEETAAALDQITATVRKTADGARQATEVTERARSGAEKSGQIVGEAVSAMAEIEKSSQQVGQIIGVIDEIAFQTNLLALNAGVEAARAGEAGKGFAVVAQEVRGLAQRSAEAAREIKELISTSTVQVGHGVELVGQTGEALQAIVGQVVEISSLVSEIAASAQEQSTGLGEVNSAVNQMDQVTQQNAAMVEESTAASHSLAQEAQELARLVAEFKLGEKVASHPARPAANVTPVRTPASSRPMAALKTVGTGGQAAALLAEQPEDEGWEEF